MLGFGLNDLGTSGAAATNTCHLTPETYCLTPIVSGEPGESV